MEYMIMMMMNDDECIEKWG